jgi:hypothetical protein
MSTLNQAVTNQIAIIDEIETGRLNLKIIVYQY